MEAALAGVGRVSLDTCEQRQCSTRASAVTLGLQPHAHDSVEDECQEADHGVGADAVGQTVVNRCDLDVRFQDAEAALDVCQSLVARDGIGGCEVRSIATTIAEGFVVGMRAMSGNPYDGHTLAEALEQVETLTDQCPDLAVVDRGYRGHGVEKTMVLISGQRRGITPSLKTLLRRRSAIEPEIGHMKADGRLARCPLKGTSGDALFAVLCGCGHNIRKILAHLRALYRALITWVLAELLWQELKNLGPQTA